MRTILVIIFITSATQVNAAENIVERGPLISFLYLGNLLGLVTFMTTFLLPILINEKFASSSKRIIKTLYQFHVCICAYTLINSCNWLAGDWYVDIAFSENAKNNPKFGLAVIIAYLILYSPFIGLIGSLFFGKISIDKIKKINN